VEKVVQTLLFLCLLLVAGAVAAAALRPALRRTIGKSLLSGTPRDQGRIFELRLRDVVFRNPFATMEVLFSEGRDGFLHKLWDQSKPPPRRAGFEPGLPADGMFVYRTHLADGRAVAVIATPPPERHGELYRIAVVLPQDPRLREDVARARRQTRFFTLHRGSGETGRDTDLRGWTYDGRRRDYNVGAPLDPRRFAAALGEKLRELRL
jgi:hypothetical protein